MCQSPRHFMCFAGPHVNVLRHRTGAGDVHDSSSQRHPRFKPAGTSHPEYRGHPVRESELGFPANLLAFFLKRPDIHGNQIDTAVGSLDCFCVFDPPPRRVSRDLPSRWHALNSCNGSPLVTGGWGGEICDKEARCCRR